MSAVLLVLGGGALAAPALRWAREAGLDTVLADPDPHAVLRRAAHEFHLIPEGTREAHAALARRLARTRRLAGVLATTRAAFALLPGLSESVPGLYPSRAALERLRSPDETRTFLASKGLPVCAERPEGADALDLFAFFRDGAFVPGGAARRSLLASGDECSLQPTGLAPEREHAAYALLERAARAAGLTHGPLQGTLIEHDGALALHQLWPGFADLVGAAQVARLALGKSVLQAWFAHLAGAGGPFDELALTARAAAGWLAVAPERAGLFAGLDGVASARALPGVVGLWSDEPGRMLASPELAQPPLGYVWVEGRDCAEVAARLQAARAALTPRMTGRQRVA